MVAPLDTPTMQEFVDALAPVNRLAEASPGFVWRFQTPIGNATSLRVYDDDYIIVNFSVWKSVDALRHFVYKGLHTDYMRRRSQWFERMAEQHMALWWVPIGHAPTWEEAQDRLEMLRGRGESPDAFTFRNWFPPPAERPTA
jgi:hypothetical protein